MPESQDDTGSAPEESPDSEAPTVPPLEVKVTNQTKPTPKWNDSHDDLEYDELGISAEDMDI